MTGTNLQIVNLLSAAITAGNAHAYQMTTWQFASVGSKNFLNFNVVFTSRMSDEDDGADQYYAFNGATIFDLQGRSTDNSAHYLQVACQTTLPNTVIVAAPNDWVMPNIDQLTAPLTWSTFTNGTNVQIGYMNSGPMSVILLDLTQLFDAADAAIYYAAVQNKTLTADQQTTIKTAILNYYNPPSPYPTPATWMRDINSVIGNQPLYKVCMPGAHDSGMSTYNSSFATSLVSDSNTQTQTLHYSGLLKQGIRYFDARPCMWTDKNYYLGHFGYTNFLTRWQGACGITLQDAINDVAAFVHTDGCQEVVILDFSHPLDYYQTGTLGNGYFFYEFQTQAIINMLTAALKDKLYQNSGVTSLCGITINEVLNSGANVIALFSTEFLTLASVGATPIVQAGTVAWPESSLPIYNEYTGTLSVPTMMADQMSKLTSNPPNPNQLFLLSWTITLTDLTDNLNYDIIAQATGANGALYRQITNAVSAGSINQTVYPNIILTDNCSEHNTLATMLSVTINKLVN